MQDIGTPRLPEQAGNSKYCRDSMVAHRGHRLVVVALGLGWRAMADPVYLPGRRWPRGLGLVLAQTMTKACGGDHIREFLY
jgi:hypothetical protein